MNLSSSLFTDVALSIAVLVLILGAFATQIRRRAGSIPLFAMLAGIALSPLIPLSDLPQSAQFGILYDVASLALATGLFGSALTLPRWDVLHHTRALLLMIGVVLPLMWLTAGAAAYLALGLPLTTALLIGASVAPTDPVLARTIVLGRVAEDNVPAPLRRLILEESSINDGVGLPLVMLMAVLTTGKAFSASDWIPQGVVWSVVLAIPLGLVLGRLGAWGHDLVLALADSAPPIFRIASPLALAILSLMFMRLIGMDGVLGVFFVGVAFAASRRKQDVEDERELQELVDDLFSVVVFFIFGLVLPWSAWVEDFWPLLLFAAAVIGLRRLPWVLLLGRWAPEIRSTAESAFTGWFGPVGVSALLYTALVAGTASPTEVWPPVAAVVALNVVVFGLSGTPLTRLLGRRRGVPHDCEGEQRMTR